MNNKMLHVFNYMWLGGVPCFIRNMMQVYPQFHHVCAYLNSSLNMGDGVPRGEDFDMLQEWENVFGADCGFIYDGILRKSLIDEIDPAIVVLQGISGNRLEGEWPYQWLRERPTMFIHHMNSRPHLQVDFDVFVSNSLFQKYQDTKDRMRKWVICPPVIDTSVLASIPRPRPSDGTVVIGKLCSDWNAKKYPKFMLDMFRKLNEEYPGKLKFVVVGADKHWSNHGIPNLETPPVKSRSIVDFLKSMDIMLYMNDDLPETWGRSVTEAMAAGACIIADDCGGIPEQIENDNHGWLVKTPTEAMGFLREAIENRAVAHSMGEAARERAVAEFGLDRLTRDTADFMLSALTGGA